MFGGAVATRQDVLRRISNDTTGQEDLGQQGGNVVAGANVERTAENPNGQSANQSTQEARADAGIDGYGEGFELNRETPAEWRNC